MNNTWKYARNLCKFVLLGLLAGVVCGGVGTAFYHAVALATRLRKAHPWLLYLLPAAGLLTAYLYALLKMEKDPGTDAVLWALMVCSIVSFVVNLFGRQHFESHSWTLYVLSVLLGAWAPPSAGC